MIVDKLSHASLYYPLSPRLERALRFLEVMDPDTAVEGRHDIAGEQVYALVQEYATKPMASGAWEAHRRYMDVQYVAAGVEQIGYAHVDTLQAGEYDTERDFLGLTGEGQFLRVPAGFFVILAPHDAHMPGMALDTPAPVKKVVVKVRV